MGAPQVIAIILLTVNVAVGLCCHGKQIEISFGGRLIGAAIWVAILYFGGFFDS